MHPPESPLPTGTDSDETSDLADVRSKIEAADASATLRGRVDISRNRREQKWSPGELIVRALWETLRVPIFAWSPRQFWGWRCAVLKLFGARVGKEVHLYPTVRIAVPWTLRIGDGAAIGDGAILYGLGPITIGQRSTVSQFAHICAGTHDYRDAAMPLVKATVEIGDDVWICADAFVGPGVRVGSRAIVGARAVAVRDIEDDTIVVGNPARVVGRRTNDE